jgi:hypothetical protein
MMEGYFVRTLGMHRVYNSAFMNMLKNEDNAKYRSAIKSVMDFNPEIMKRYVNFMNNPDEETAIAQFGKDDKYFGVCTLMCTLPGLPMFGHGQIEGFSEKYGMEYKRAYWDEQEDWYLIERHEKEIFPLLEKRYLFSQVENFILYDLIGPEGFVNENVYAFSNRIGDEKAVVLYNNAYEQSRGWIKYSSASAQKDGLNFKRFTLSEGLALGVSNSTFIIFRDQISNLEYIRHSGDLAHHGLYVELDGFKYHVFLDFREVQENDYGHYSQIADYLGGRGVPNIEETLKETFLKPVHQPIDELMQSGFLQDTDKFVKSMKTNQSIPKAILIEFEKRMTVFISEVQKYISGENDITSAVKNLKDKLYILLLLYKPALLFESKQISELKKITKRLSEDGPSPSVLTLWLIFADLGRLQDKNYAPLISLSWLDEFLFYKLILRSLIAQGFDEKDADRQLQLIKCMILNPDWMEKSSENPVLALQSLFQTQEIQQFLNVNQYHEILYYHFESFVELLNALYTVNILNLLSNEGIKKRGIKKKLEDWYGIVVNMINHAQDSESRVEDTITALKTEN